MILPPGTTLRLDPRDEYTHEPEPVSNYNESMYFNAFSTHEGVGTWMRIGNRPNEGHAEMSCCVYLPDGRVGFMHGRPPIRDNRAMDAGALRFEVLEPFRRLAARYEGELLLMDEPRDMANPSAAFKANPKVPARIALQFEGISPMFGGEVVRIDGQPHVIDPEQSTSRGHTEQNLAVRGQVTVDGTSYPIEGGTGYRDKSWGPRHWHNYYWYRWLPVTFDRDFGIVVTIRGRRDAPPVITGNILRDGAFEPVEKMKLQTQWGEDFHHRAFTLELETASRRYEVEGRVKTLLPLRHKALPGQDPGTFTRIAQGLTEYRCEGRRVLGMSEYCDLVTGGVPVTHTLGLERQVQTDRTVKT